MAKKRQTEIQVVEVSEETEWNLAAIETVGPTNTTVDDDSIENVPTMENPDWHDYVMSNFIDSELVENCPTVAGLRRVSQKLLGEIMFSGPIQVFPPSADSGSIDRSTVVYKVEFAWRQGVDFGGINISKFNFPIKTFIDVADVWSGNAEYKYATHTSSLASTRAEARVLRKALQLRVVSADEVGKTEDNPIDNESMTRNQQSTIEAKCDSMKIDMFKLAAANGLSANPLKWTKSDGSKLMSAINKFQTDGATGIPAEVMKD